MSTNITQAGEAFNFTGTGDISGLGDCQLVGMLCSQSSSGVITITDKKGRAIVTSMPLTAGQFYPIPARCLGGVTITLVSGTFNCTLFATN